MINNAVVTPLEWKDVRGKEQLYLKIEHNQNTVLINIGRKTFDSVRELLTESKTTQQDLKEKVIKK